MFGYSLKVRNVLVAAARDTFCMILESMLGSVLELVLELMLAPLLGCMFVGFGTRFGIVLGTFKLFKREQREGKGEHVRRFYV